MKQLVCEMCGGTDILKQDGYFVCQNCGVKYQPEEARKMLVEIQGTVQIDRSCEIENMMKNADATYSDKNYRAAYDLYTHRSEQYCYTALKQRPLNRSSIEEACRIIERLIRTKYDQLGESPLFFNFCGKLFNDIDLHLSDSFSVVYLNSDEIIGWCFFMDRMIYVIDELVQNYIGAEDCYYESVISVLQKAIYYHHEIDKYSEFRLKLIILGSVKFYKIKFDFFTSMRYWLSHPDEK